MEIDLGLKCVQRGTPDVSDVFECAYDVKLCGQFIGTYYKLVNGGGYTASSLAGDVYVSPGACIVSILGETSLGVTRYLERAINMNVLEGV